MTCNMHTAHTAHVLHSCHLQCISLYRQYLRRVLPESKDKDLLSVHPGKKNGPWEEFSSFEFVMEEMPGDGHCIFHCLLRG